MVCTYCVLCGDHPRKDKTDYQAWRVEHDQKDHPTYYAIQVGILE